MSDYTEHLISMAGGDGDDALDLNAIQAQAEINKYLGRTASQDEAMNTLALLALVREQQARIGRVERARKELWDVSNDDHWTAETRAVYRDASRAIFVALTATDQR